MYMSFVFDNLLMFFNDEPSEERLEKVLRALFTGVIRSKIVAILATNDSGVKEVVYTHIENASAADLANQIGLEDLALHHGALIENEKIGWN